MTTARALWPRRAGELTLRRPSPADIDQVLTWRADPAVTRWLIRTEVNPDVFRATWLADDPRTQRVVALRGATVVGTGSLWVTDALGQSHTGSEVWGDAEAGLDYLIDPVHAGNGYASAIAGTLLAVAFDELGLHRVTAGCFAANAASWHIMDKLGMRREQHGVKDSWHAELGWVDGFTYALLAEEWRARPRTP